MFIWAISFEEKVFSLFFKGPEPLCFLLSFTKDKIVKIRLANHITDKNWLMTTKYAELKTPNSFNPVYTHRHHRRSGHSAICIYFISPEYLCIKAWFMCEECYSYGTVKMALWVHLANLSVGINVTNLFTLAWNLIKMSHCDVFRFHSHFKTTLRVTFGSVQGCKLTSVE